MPTLSSRKPWPAPTRASVYDSTLVFGLFRHLHEHRTSEPIAKNHEPRRCNGYHDKNFRESETFLHESSDWLSPFFGKIAIRAGRNRY